MTKTSQNLARRRSYAIRARQAATKAAAPKAANDNFGVRCKFVDTTMTPGMLAACVAASGIGQ